LDDFTFEEYPLAGYTRNHSMVATGNTVVGNFVLGSSNGIADTVRSYHESSNVVGGTKTVSGVPRVTQTAYADVSAVTSFSAGSLRKAIYIPNMTTAGKFTITAIGTLSAFAQEAKADSLIVTASDSTSFNYRWISN
jgi:hypothetical protein